MHNSCKKQCKKEEKRKIKIKINNIKQNGHLMN